MAMVEEMEQSLVSVVIATYNRLDLLMEAVDSVKRQAYENWELIVVDDGSRDGTWNWLESLQNRKISAFRMAVNSDRPAAANLGLAKARGEFVLFLDDDDRLRLGALADLVEPLKHHPKAVAAIGARVRFRDGVTLGRINHPLQLCKRVIWPEVLEGWRWSTVPTQILIRTKVARQVGGFRPTYSPADDREQLLRIALLGPVMLVPEVVVEYRLHKGGQQRPEDIDELRETMFEEFIAGLPLEELPRAKRIRQSAYWSQLADQEHNRGNYAAAFRAHIRSARSAPELLRSPLTGPPTVRGCVNSLLRLLHLPFSVGRVRESDSPS